MAELKIERERERREDRRADAKWEEEKTQKILISILIIECNLTF